MEEVIKRYTTILESLNGQDIELVAVSKRQPIEKVKALYELGHRDFGENRVQEWLDKKDEFSKDTRWHIIGHLQTNKVKYVVGDAYLIHSLDRLKLAKEINKISKKAGVQSRVLLQIKIAEEDSKFGYDFIELVEELASGAYEKFTNINICGVMGMATFTDDAQQIRAEFKKLKRYFDELKSSYFGGHPDFSRISMGMSGDYQIAIEEGANCVRIGSSIFGEREGY